MKEALKFNLAEKGHFELEKLLGLTDKVQLDDSSKYIIDVALKYRGLCRAFPYSEHGFDDSSNDLLLFEYKKNLDQIEVREIEDLQNQEEVKKRILALPKVTESFAEHLVMSVMHYARRHYDAARLASHNIFRLELDILFIHYHVCLSLSRSEGQILIRRLCSIPFVPTPPWRRRVEGWEEEDGEGAGDEEGWEEEEEEEEEVFVDYIAPRMVPTTQDSIMSLKRKRVEEESDQNCIICLEKLSQGFEAVSLPCLHSFHGDCIEEWLNTSHYCPICRFKMPSISTH